MIRISIYIILLVVLSSCYCFNEAVTIAPEPRELNRRHEGYKCIDWGGKGKSFQMNSYYGFPSSIKLRNTLKNWTNTTADFTKHDYKTTGQFGLRVEKYLPSFIVPFRVLGVGFDYAYGQHTIDLSAQGESSSFAIQNHRMMVSVNHMTFVQGSFIGYASLQSGVNKLSYIKENDMLSLEGNNQVERLDFAFRIGYGLQYYFKNSLALTLEMGYGDGAYLRAGFVWWFY